LGNMNALRDWGHAHDYVKMQWLMLQQDKPDDFAIGTGEQHSVREFVDAAAHELGITLRWEGEGVDEQGIVESNANDTGPKLGEVIVRVDPRYFRPTEVETLLCDPTKAKEKLGWVPEITFKELVAEMAREDLALAQKDVVIENAGFRSYRYFE
ncbi:MAG: GDP-mannose 4,6-dehydratase, partial [Candidatus Thiodiazotropha endolucinida]|nr:GDP-mannose 4,6-dehydratase [Candidatus Thiodiazotropha taylori]MCW4249738.1 GDP-mannose 4,6-dehydratase [Candidatus Thiodiazotropha endolucinida]